MRNKGEQVSENRFKPHQFDSNVQTDSKLGRYKRDTACADTSTRGKSQGSRKYASL